MATPEALIKYYDCLKDSFNKIQDKDNKTALINAALRPKICEEFAKSEQVLNSYLNYIQVFSLIYSDKFSSICTNIIAPLLKEDDSTAYDEMSPHVSEKLTRVHQTIQTIVESRNELGEDFVHSVVKVFPSMSTDDTDDNRRFLSYLKNCLRVCMYLSGENLVILLSRIIERVNPLDQSSDEEEKERLNQATYRAYELIYKFIEMIDRKQLSRFVEALIASFTREFLSYPPAGSQLNYLLLYACSLDEEFSECLIGSLWKTFTDSKRPFEERRASVNFASSFIARANYVGLNKTFEYLETASAWCIEYLDDYQESETHDRIVAEDVGTFYALTQSIFYLITQRYRDIYEEETIAKLMQLNLSRILECPLRPLENCDLQTSTRFQEVATLCRIDCSVRNQLLPIAKRRKSDREPKGLNICNAPFDETCNSLPERIKPLYRNYFNHRNFTIYRE